MKPFWDKLAEEYEDSATILIADVDCTAAGEGLCQQMEVSRYPTIKYGDPNNLVKYEGGRTAEDVNKFAAELGPNLKCGPANPEFCDKDTKKLLDSFMAMPMGDLAAKIKEKDAEFEAKQQELEVFKATLQAMYERQDAATKANKEAINQAADQAGLRIMKNVKRHKMMGGGSEL